MISKLISERFLVRSWYEYVYWTDYLYYQGYLETRVNTPLNYPRAVREHGLDIPGIYGTIQNDLKKEQYIILDLLIFH